MEDYQVKTSLTAITEYNALLSRMDELTDQLSNAIQDSRIEAVDTLVGARDALCKRIAASSRALDQSAAGSDSPEAALSSLPASDRDAVRRALQDTERLHDLLMKKQVACETALATRIKECRAGLTALGRRKGLQTAYQSPQAKGAQSRFLDNRL